MRPSLLYAGLVAIVTASTIAGAQDTTQADAVRMEKKVSTIVLRGAQPKPKPPTPIRTGFTDREVNAYFRIKGPEFLPEGVLNPQVAIGDGGKLNARATVDLDAALKTKERSFFDPLSWLGGKTEVTATGTVRAAEGMGTLQLESATLGGITIPKTLLQTLVSYYTRTPEAPQGFDIDKPFILPAGIRAVETKRGEATVVQP